MKVPVTVNASLPITAISSEANGIWPLYFMFIDVYFRAELTSPPLFLFPARSDRKPRTPSAGRSGVVRAALRALCSAIKWDGVKNGHIYTLMCGSGQQHPFCWNISGQGVSSSAGNISSCLTRKGFPWGLILKSVTGRALRWKDKTHLILPGE